MSPEPKTIRVVAFVANSSAFILCLWSASIWYRMSPAYRPSWWPVMFYALCILALIQVYFIALNLFPGVVP